jgi:nitrite reductase/ring-hydroxylating ferredoxin subunit
LSKAGPMTWVQLARLDDFAERDVIGVTHADRKVAIYKLDDAFYATTDVCPHQSGRLSDGEVVEGYIECPAHYALFDIRTGKSGGGVTTADLKTYGVKVEGADIFVELD